MSSVYASVSAPEPVGFARLSPEARRLLGRVGGLMSAASRDTAAMAAKARRGLWAKFLREADPQGMLSERERIARAERLQKAHYAKMSLARWGKSAPAKPAKPAKPARDHDSDSSDGGDTGERVNDALDAWAAIHGADAMAGVALGRALAQREVKQDSAR